MKTYVHVSEDCNVNATTHGHIRIIRALAGFFQLTFGTVQNISSSFSTDCRKACIQELWPTMLRMMMSTMYFRSGCYSNHHNTTRILFLQLTPSIHHSKIISASPIATIIRNTLNVLIPLRFCNGIVFCCFCHLCVCWVCVCQENPIKVPVHAALMVPQLEFSSHESSNLIELGNVTVKRFWGLIDFGRSTDEVGRSNSFFFFFFTF